MKLILPLLLVLNAQSDIRSLQYVVDNCFRKIFDIKLKETVEECMREFNVSTMNDVIDARKILSKIQRI